MNHTICQFRDKHTVGGIVFYKHAFLVLQKLHGLVVEVHFMAHQLQKVLVNTESEYFTGETFN